MFKFEKENIEESAKSHSLHQKPSNLKTRKSTNLDPSQNTSQDEGKVLRVPTQERSRKLFQKILIAAADAFASQGLDAASLEEIALEAGTSSGSIYRYFSNKHALFTAVTLRKSLPNMSDLLEILQLKIGSYGLRTCKVCSYQGTDDEFVKVKYKGGYRTRNTCLPCERNRRRAKKEKVQHELCKEGLL